MKRGQGGRKRARKHTEAVSFVESLLAPEARGLILSAPPPHHQESEQAVLGAMMTEKAAAVRAISMLKADDFHSAQHQIIFSIMSEMLKGDIPIGLVTLSARLGEQGLVQVGGLEYLSTLSEYGMTANLVAVKEWATTVRHKAILRQQRLAICSYLERPDDERRAVLMEWLTVEPSSEMEWIPLDQLLLEEDKQEYLIYPILPLDAVTLLLADWHMGKSWLALDLVHALAMGANKWLGYYDIQRKGGALYVDGETGKLLMHQRWQQLDLGAGVPKPTPPVSDNIWEEENDEPDPIDESSFRPADGTFFPKIHLGPRMGIIESRIRERKARVVILDSALALAAPGMDVYKPEFWLRALPPLKRLAMSTHCCIILLHHLRKLSGEIGVNTIADRAFGSVAVMAELHNILAITGDRHSATKTVTHEKYTLSGVQEPAFVLRFAATEDGKGKRLEHGGPALDEEAEQLEATKDLILAALKDGKEQKRGWIASTVQEIARVAGDELPSESSITRALKVMAGEQLVKPKRGIYRLKSE